MLDDESAFHSLYLIKELKQLLLSQNYIIIMANS